MTVRLELYKRPGFFKHPCHQLVGLIWQRAKGEDLGYEREQGGEGGRLTRSTPFWGFLQARTLAVNDKKDCHLLLTYHSDPCLGASFT